jgi:hypothetical protein
MLGRSRADVGNPFNPAFLESKSSHYRVHFRPPWVRMSRRNAGVRFPARVRSGHGSSLAPAGHFWPGERHPPVNGNRSLSVTNSARVGSRHHHVGIMASADRTEEAL